LFRGETVVNPKGEKSRWGRSRRSGIKGKAGMALKRETAQAERECKKG